MYAAGDSRVPEVLTVHGASVVEEGSRLLNLLEARLDAVVSDRCGFVWDHAPGVVLTAEAGGRFTDPSGGARPDLEGGIYSNGHLHAVITEILRAAGIGLAGAGPRPIG